MTVFATIAFTTFLLENNHFVTLHERNKHLADNLRAVYCRSADLYRTLRLAEKNTVKLYLVTLFGILTKIVNIQELLRLCLELLSLDFYNCVHPYL